MFESTDYHSHDHHEVTSHALRFEAYELPKPSGPPEASTELVPVTEPSYYSESHQPISTSLASERESSEIKLRLDGVKQKWGRPSYQPTTSASSTPQQAANGTTTHSDGGGGGVGSSSSKPRSSYESKKPEIDPEKQRLAASLFGGSSSSRTDRKSSGGHKPAKGTANKPATIPKENPAPVQPPPPDLLDFGEPTATSVAATDPFKELEGLLDSSSQDGGATDVMGLYSDAAPVTTTTTSVDSLLSELSDSSKGNSRTNQSQTSKGPNSKEALEKDALVRQMGVNPTSQNPTLFKDLLG